MSNIDKDEEIRKLKELNIDQSILITKLVNDKGLGVVKKSLCSKIVKVVGITAVVATVIAVSIAGVKYMDDNDLTINDMLS